MQNEENEEEYEDDVKELNKTVLRLFGLNLFRHFSTSKSYLVLLLVDICLPYNYFLTVLCNFDLYAQCAETSLSSLTIKFIIYLLQIDLFTFCITL